MNNHVIKNFDEWIFEAAAPGPKKPAPSAKQETIPPGYIKTNLDLQKNVELSTKDQTTGVKGWKALKNTDLLQTSGDLDYQTGGLASDKIEDFDKAAKDKTGTMIMSPTLWGDSEGRCFAVGFPYSRALLTSPEIILSKKYLLFTPFQNSEPQVFASETAKIGYKPANFRLMPTDKLASIGLQSLMWCMGLNNSGKAREEMKKFDREDVYSMIKKGLASLSQISKVAGANDSARIINDGYNALISLENLGAVLFNNLVSGHKTITQKDMVENFPPKKA